MCLSAVLIWLINVQVKYLLTYNTIVIKNECAMEYTMKAEYRKELSVHVVLVLGFYDV
jgi:hypothetical protein